MAGTLERGLYSPTQLVVIAHGKRQENPSRFLGPERSAPRGPAPDHHIAAVTDQPGDCPECGSAGSVDKGLCQVCYAEFNEVGAADLPPADPRPGDPPTFTPRSPSV